MKMVELTISKRIRAVHGSKNWDGKQDKELRNLTDKVKRSVLHFKHDAALAIEVKSMSNEKFKQWASTTGIRKKKLSPRDARDNMEDELFQYVIEL